MTDLTELEIDGIYSRRNTIIINRADLPKVRERDGRFWAGSGPEECVARSTENPNWLRGHANSAIALAEFLEAREKNAAETAAAAARQAERQNRREYLAEIFAPGRGWNRLSLATQHAIDYILANEDKKHA